MKIKSYPWDKMEKIIDMKDDIMDWLFFINLFSIFVGFFMFSKLIFIVVMSINLILNSTFIIMSKWGDKFTEQIDKGDEDGNV